MHIVTPQYFQKFTKPYYHHSNIYYLALFDSKIERTSTLYTFSSKVTKKSLKLIEDDILVFGYVPQEIERKLNLEIPNEIKSVKSSIF